MQKCQSLSAPIPCSSVASQTSNDNSSNARATQLEQELIRSRNEITLLAAYPDLSGAIVTHYHEALVDQHGNVNQQMMKQIEANDKRISIITRENAKLRNALGFYTLN